MDVSFEYLPKADVEGWVHSLHSTRPSMALGVLLAGDRCECITETVVAKINNTIVGIATIAPEGEQLSGEPTIVALYVLPEYRQKGIGFQLLEAAIDHMIKKGIAPIRIDVLHSKVLKMVNRLPTEKRQKLNVVDQSMGGVLDSVLDT